MVACSAFQGWPGLSAQCLLETSWLGSQQPSQAATWGLGRDVRVAEPEFVHPQLHAQAGPLRIASKHLLGHRLEVTRQQGPGSGRTPLKPLESLHSLESLYSSAETECEIHTQEMLQLGAWAPKLRLLRSVRLRSASSASTSRQAEGSRIQALPSLLGCLTLHADSR